MLERLEPLLERMRVERPALLALVGRLTESEAARSRPGDNYSARATLAHLAGAERGMTRLGQRMAAGENPRLAPNYDNNFYNARQQDKRKDMTVAQLEAELAESRRELLIFMESLTDETLARRGEHPVAGDVSVWYLLRVIVDHEREHTVELENWVERLVKERTTA